MLKVGSMKLWVGWIHFGLKQGQNVESLEHTDEPSGSRKSGKFRE
jgi:hypothetical protein